MTNGHDKGPRFPVRRVSVCWQRPLHYARKWAGQLSPAPHPCPINRALRSRRGALLERRTADPTGYTGGARVCGAYDEPGRHNAFDLAPRGVCDATTVEQVIRDWRVDGAARVDRGAPCAGHAGGAVADLWWLA